MKSCLDVRIMVSKIVVGLFETVRSVVIACTDYSLGGVGVSDDLGGKALMVFGRPCDYWIFKGIQ